MEASFVALAPSMKVFYMHWITRADADAVAAAVVRSFF
jgi:hypothetical protein